MIADRLRAAAWPVVLYALAAAFAVWHVRLLEEPSTSLERLAGLAVLGLLPALATTAGGAIDAGRRYAVALLPTVVVAVGVTTGHWPLRPHLLGHTGYFALVWDDLSNGARLWTSVLLPYDPARYPDLRIAVSLAVFALFAVLAAALVVWRAPFAALVVAFVPFMAVSTVYVLDERRLRGVAMLALALLLLGTLRGRREARRRGGSAVPVGAAVLALAVVAVAVPGVAKGAFFNWREWKAPEQRGASVSYVWDHTYGRLIRPPEPYEVLHVESPVQAYWRAVVLDGFDGTTWRATPGDGVPVDRASVSIPAGQIAPIVRQKAGTRRFVVKFSNVGLDEPYLLTAEQPLVVSRIPGDVGTVSVGSDNVVSTEHSAPVKSGWEVAARRIDPTPKQLAKAGTDYPTEIRNRDLLLGSDGDPFPAMGEYRESVRRQVADSVAARQFVGAQAWIAFHAKVEELTAGLSTPYEKVVVLERYFQGFNYDETADFSRAPQGPLPAFFFDRRKIGYCQMFSGAMAAALRMLGIPARVAEGFTPGTADRNGTYVVTDRDAHSWVEVYFPKVGWVPFEPTPTRALPSDSSSTSPQWRPNSFPSSSLGARLTQLGIDPALRARLKDAQLGGSAANGSLGLAAKKPWRPGFFSYLLLAAIGVASLIPLAKRVRTARTYAARAPHAIAAAVRADLVAYVVDQQARNGHDALTPTELARLLKRDFGVDARHWVECQTRARYGPDGPGALTAAHEARTAARHVKRDLRRTLTRAERLTGALRLRSLLP